MERVGQETPDSRRNGFVPDIPVRPSTATYREKHSHRYQDVAKSFHDRFVFAQREIGNGVFENGTVDFYISDTRFAILEKNEGWMAILAPHDTPVHVPAGVLTQEPTILTLPELALAATPSQQAPNDENAQRIRRELYLSMGYIVKLLQRHRSRTLWGSNWENGGGI